MSRITTARLLPRARMLSLTLLLLVAPIRATAGQVIFAERRFDRELSVWFGTLFVVGAPAPSQDFVRLSDRISDGLRTAFEGDASVDGRVGPVLSSWVNVLQTNVEWVLEQSPAPDNFPALQNLLAAYTGAALTLQAMFGPGFLTTTTPVMSAREYLLTTFISHEFGPVFVGDSDNPISVGVAGQVVTSTNNFIAQARYFAQNATWTRQSTVVPEPSTLALFGLALGLFGVFKFSQRRTS